jgi:putative ABC transport system permease protein
MARVPLAWLNLTHDARRFALSLAGVGFAVVLVFVEYGFYNALLDATVAIIDHFDADLVMVSKTKTSLETPVGFPRRRLVQALGVPGVAAVRPLYVQVPRAVWRGAGADRRQALRLIAFHPDAPAVRFAEADAHAADLRLPDRVLFDRASRTTHATPDGAARDDLAGRDAVVAGEFHLGLDFVHEGNLLAGDAAYAHYFPAHGGSALRQVDVGMIRLVPGADATRVIADLTEQLRTGVATADNAGGDDVTVMTRDAFRAAVRRYWRDATPVGFVFGLGALMGLIVGVVICYQVLATDVADHLPEFATLKAMGYGDLFLCGVVLRQALWLAVCGFVPGLLVSGVLYALLAELTGLPMLLTWDRAALVLAGAVVMCTVSGLITLRKVVTADPAELF